MRAAIGDDINADVYRRAALERVATAEQLLESQDYVMASYLAGLGVECILRAYRLRIDASFEGRHDLRALSRLSLLLDRVPERHQEEIRAALAQVCLRWANAHRFYSADALRGFLTRVGLNRLPHGRLLRADQVNRSNADVIVRSARILVDVGDRLWQLSH